eukprot:3791471-Amphidinium_carterae.1
MVERVLFEAYSMGTTFGSKRGNATKTYKSHEIKTLSTSLAEVQLNTNLVCLLKSWWLGAGSGHLTREPASCLNCGEDKTTSSDLAY